MTIGRAIAAYRRQLFAELGVSNTQGKPYREAMTAYLTEAGFRQDCPDGFTEAARTNLQHCIDHFEAVEAWRALLDAKRRRKLNNPTVLWRVYQKETQPRERQPRETIRASAAQLAENLDEAKRRIAELPLNSARTMPPMRWHGRRPIPKPKTKAGKPASMAYGRAIPGKWPAC
jgi:hypothetical protein